MYYYGAQRSGYQDHLLDSEKPFPAERRRVPPPKHHWSKELQAACEASASARAGIHQPERMQEYLLPQSGPSWQQVSLAIVNSLLGVGVVGLPETLRAAGWIGLLVLFFAALVTSFTAKLLVWSFHTCNQRKVNADAVGKGFVSTYEQIAEEATGRKRAAYFTRCVVAAECYGYALGCRVLHVANWTMLLQTIVHTVGRAPRSSSALLVDGCEMQVIIGLFLFLALPTTLLQPRPRQQLALLGLGSNLVILLVTILGPILAGLPLQPGQSCPRIDTSISFASISVGDSFDHSTVRPSGLGLAAGLALFVFGGQHTSLPKVYFSMAANQRVHFDKAVNWGYGIAFAFCALFSAAAYFLYGGCVADVFSLNLMGGLPVLGGIATLSLLLNTFGTFALFLAPVVDIVTHALQPSQALPAARSNTHLGIGVERPPLFVAMSAAAVAVRLLLLLLAGAIAWGLPHFGMLAGLFGSFASMFCSVILPILFYFQVHLLHVTLLKRCVAGGIVIGGIVGLVCGVHSTVSALVCTQAWHLPFLKFWGC